MAEDKSWMFAKEHHSELYQKFRPRLPASLFQLIHSKLLESGCKAQNSGKWAKALDIACGTGLSTYPLAEFVEEVTGVDLSPTQIEQAILAYGDCKGLKFVKADVSEVEGMWCGESFDLITVGVAAHWMCPHTLFKAARKLLKKNGLMAVYCPHHQEFKHPSIIKLHHEFLEAIHKPLLTEEIHQELATYDKTEQAFLHYFPNAKRVDLLLDEREMTVDEIKGYFGSFSSYQRMLCHKEPGDEDLLETLYQKMKVIGGENKKFTYCLPYHFIFASKT